MSKFYMIILYGCILLNVKYESYSQNYTALGMGTNYAIFDIYSDSLENKIYIGGGFSLAGGIQSHCFAIWDGISWDSTRNQFPSPPTSQVRSIQKFNNKIYVGGSLGVFDTSGNQIGYGIATWDSLSQCWESDSVFGFVEVLGIYNGDLIIGGNFTGIDTIVSNKIIGYNGASYYSFPNLDTLGGGVIAIREFNSDLYVGGNFDSQIASDMKDIVKWDGTQWLSVGGGLSGFSTFVEAIEIYQGKLVIGGWFKEAYGDPGNGIAAWDGTQWSNFGTGIQSGGIRCMAVYNNDLWVGGSFSNIGGVNVTNLARWDGTQWNNVGLNLNNSVWGMTVFNNDLYIGGFFKTVNGDTVNNIIKYSSTTGYSDSILNNLEFNVFPNPSKTEVRVQAKLCQISNNLTIVVKDIYGNVVLSEQIMGNDFINQIINISELISGLYFITLSNNNRVIASEKILISR